MKHWALDDNLAYIYLEANCPLFKGVDLPFYGSNLQKYGAFLGVWVKISGAF